MELTVTLNQGYKDAMLEEAFEKLRQEQRIRISVKAGQDGVDNKPTSLTHYQIQVLNPIKSAIQEIIELNAQRHQPISDFAIANAIRSQAQEEMGILNSKANNAERNFCN